MSVHEDLSHMGTVTVISKLNERFWLIKGAAFVKKVILKCLACQAQKANTVSPQMGVLPEVRRLALVEPFTNVGLDVAGHFMIKSHRAKLHPRKIWVLIVT